ncbi:hypothetical protein [Streptomyces sp. NPDC005408]|uniref:hypothetical protein n=1 Tax=Streptomyces sp. NPDC005408 TaxID=3155341 RepID=UPI0033B5828C
MPTEPLAGLDTRTRDARDQAAATQPGKVISGEVDLPDAKWTGHLTRELHLDDLFANHTTLRTGRLTIERRLK